MNRLASVSGFRAVVCATALAFLAVFLLYPLWLVLKTGLQDSQGAWSVAPYVQTLGSRYYLRSLGDSLAAGALTMLGAAAIGVPLAFCLARVSVPGKGALLTLSSLPLLLPSFVSAYALTLLFGHAGVIVVALRQIGLSVGSIYGMPGVVIVFVLTFYPYVLMPTLAGFRAINISVEEAARNLGGSRWRTFRTVLLPIVIPSVLAGALLVFIESLENFGVPAVLSQNQPFLAVDIFNLFAGESEPNPAAAAVLSVVLVGVSVLVLLVQRRYLAGRRFATGARQAPPPIPLSRPWLMLATVFSWGAVLLSLFPFGAVLVISFLQFHGPVLSWEVGFGNYAALLGGSYQPLYNTGILATIAAVVTTILGAPIGYVLVRHRSQLAALLDVVGIVPFAVSGTVLGIGLIMAFNSGWVVLTGGWFILVVAYTVRKLPFSIRSSSAVVHQIDPSLEEASINLGVSPLRTFITLTVPMMSDGLVGGMVLIWVTVASELSSTIVLYSSHWVTMTVLMFQTLEGTAPGESAAAAAILTLFAAIPLLLVHRLLRRQNNSML